MNKRKLSIFISVMTLSLCAFSNTASAAPSKIMTFTNMPAWDYHETNYDNNGNVRVNAGKTTFNLNGKQKPSYIPMFNVKEAEVKAPVTIGCELKTDEQKSWFKNLSKVTIEDSTKNPNLEQKLEFEKNGDNIIVKGNQRALDNNRLYNIKIYSQGYDSVTIPVNIVQAEPIRVLVSYPMNPRTGEDVRFKLENFNYAITNPLNKVFLTHNNNRKELVKLEDYHAISDLVTIYAQDEEHGEGNLLEPGQYTVEIYAYGFKKAEKKFVVTGNPIKASEKSSVEKETQSTPLAFKSNTVLSSIDTVSSASVGTSEGADNSGSGESSGGGLIKPCNLVYDHDLLANALILNELGMGTTESEGIVKRFEENTISYDAVINEDGTKINDFQDYLNAVKDAGLNGEYLTYDEYIANKNAKEYKNRPYNVKQVLEDNLLGEAQSFRDILGVKAPELEVKSAVMDKDMILQCNDTNYLNNIKAITVNGDWKEIDKNLYSVKDNRLTINSKLITGDKIQLKILSAGYKDKVIEVKLEKVLDKVDLKLEKEYKVLEDVVVTGLTSDFIKNINSIKLDGKLLLNREQAGYSSDTCYIISGDKLTLRSGLFKDAKNYKLDIDGKYYGNKQVNFTIKKVEENPPANEDKKQLPKMEVKIDSKPGFMNKYGIRFENSEQWMDSVTGVIVNGVQYNLGLSWGKTNESYSILLVDRIIEIGSDGFKKNDDNVITIKAKGYDDFTFIITKDAKISVNKEVEKEPATPEKPAVSEEKKQLPKMQVKVDSKPGFMNKYGIRFENSEQWMDSVTGVIVNGVQYNLGLSWGKTNESYSIRLIDRIIEIGSDGFKKNDDNVITIKAKGYDDFTFIITKDGKINVNKEDEKEPVTPEKPAVSEGEKEPATPEKPAVSQGEKQPNVPEESVVSEGEKQPATPEKPVVSEGEKQPATPEKPAVSEGEKQPAAPEKPAVSEDKINLPEMKVTIDSKPGFMKKYGIRFENSAQWMDSVTGVIVNGVQYNPGLSWGKTNESYSIHSVDNLIEIGSDGFKKDADNVIVIKAKGYDDFTFTITKDGNLVENK